MLLFHLEDLNLQVAMECRTTLSLCCPYLGLRRVQAALAFHVLGSGQVKQEQLLRDLCRHLAKEKPVLLEGLCQAAQRNYMSLWPEIWMATITLTGERGCLVPFHSPLPPGRHGKAVAEQDQAVDQPVPQVPQKGCGKDDAPR
ncbi:PREDICTED: maestro heat-like repeat-containing protein family member 1 [Gavialis gangeticus]|uniref:maestro heat-like repeat-containing protein family member 1 n=1 Tax=Gavialis gangeticus TaxID=94835 RepID=UPI00092EAF5C|nr:PREDICTED: maestro heat-like repeat-containing protein family member 1 [Gavialis gangeticus]